MPSTMQLGLWIIWEWWKLGFIPKIRVFARKGLEVVWLCFLVTIKISPGRVYIWWLNLESPIGQRQRSAFVGKIFSHSVLRDLLFNCVSGFSFFVFCRPLCSTNFIARHSSVHLCARVWCFRTRCVRIESAEYNRDTGWGELALLWDV